MTDHSEPPPRRTPLQSMAAHWIYPLVAIPLLTAAGVGFGYAQAPVYTAETRLAVGPGALSTGEVTAFPQAARALAQDYARWVQNSAEDRTLGVDSASRVNASPIPDSGVIRIEAQSTDPAKAQAGAEQTARKLAEAVSDSRKEANPETAYEEYTGLAGPAAQAELRLTQAQGVYAQLVGAKAPQAEIDAAGQTVVATKVAAGEASLKRDAAGQVYNRLRAQATSSSELKPVGDEAAVLTGNSRNSTTQRYGILGFAVGTVLALILALDADRRRLLPAGVKRRSIIDREGRTGSFSTDHRAQIDG